MKPNLLCAGVVASLGILLVPQSGASAELIITGGDIVTVNDLQPQAEAEAVAVCDDKIVAVGGRDEVMKLKKPGTKVMDLGRNTLVPDFIDAHGHAFSCGIQTMAANLFATPNGNVKDIASLQNTLRLKEDYAGYPALKEEEAMAFVDQAFANGWQIMSHVNGDAAVDQFIRAFRATEQKYGKADRRPVAIHAKTVRDDQIEAFKRPKARSRWASWQTSWCSPPTH